MATTTSRRRLTLRRLSWSLVLCVGLFVAGCGEPFSIDQTIDPALVLDDELLRVDPGPATVASEIRQGGNGSLTFAIREWDNVEPAEFRTVLRAATDRGAFFHTVRCLGAESDLTTTLIVQGAWFADPYPAQAEYRFEGDHMRLLISVANDASPIEGPRTSINTDDLPVLSGDTCTERELSELNAFVR